MPLAKYDPTVGEDQVAPNTPRISSPESRGITVDTRYTSLKSLISYTEGAPWTVTYFQQLLDKDNNPRGQDVGQSNIYQQYTQIQKLEIKVQSALSTSQENATNRMVTTGSSSVLAFFVPNVGDMFAADVGDGREGVFQVTNAERKTLLKDASYVIEYNLVYYSNAEPLRRKDLDSKTIRTLFYYKEFVTQGQNPLLIEEDYNAIIKLQSKFGEIAHSYMRLFFEAEYSTMIVPGQPLPIYDHYVVEAIKTILNTWDAPELRFVKAENVSGDKYLSQPQFWKALVHRDRSLLNVANRKMGLVSTKMFSRDPQMESIAYTGIKYIVYPKNPDTSFNSVLATAPKTIALDTFIIPIQTRPGNISDLIPQQDITSITEGILPLIKNIVPALPDAHYVLSKAFYDNEDETSQLEVLVNAFFDQKAINPSSLLKLTVDYQNWGGLERFYYLPIVLVLIAAVIRSK